MPRSLAVLLTVTDVGFILYWCTAGLLEMGWLQIPPEWMYANYTQAHVRAWNWSFFPMELIFSVVGLLAVSAARRGDPRWRPLAIISLTLTMAAGLMAVSYWTILGEFDPFWYGMNATLVVWPLFYLRGFFAKASDATASRAETIRFVRASASRRRAACRARRRSLRSRAAGRSVCSARH